VIQPQAVCGGTPSEGAGAGGARPAFIGPPWLRRRRMRVCGAFCRKRCAWCPPPMKSLAIEIGPSSGFRIRRFLSSAIGPRNRPWPGDKTGAMVSRLTAIDASPIGW